MSDLKPITAEEIEQLARDWYRKLDVHVPMVDLLPNLADKELVMKFPEATIHGHAGFEGWYQGVIRIFFDEKHTVRSVESKPSGGQMEVKVLVRWEASRWRPPAANSDRIIADAYQTWTVRRSETTSQLLVTSYTVDRFEYVEGSAKL